MRIGDDLKRALENPGSNPDVFERLNSYEKVWRSLRTINNKFMPGYDKTEHVTYATTFNTSAVTNEQTIINNTTYSYDGTQWLSTQKFMCGITGTGLSASNSRYLMPRITDDFAVYVLNFYLSTKVNTTNDGTNYWIITPFSNNTTFTAGGSLTSLAQGTSSDSADAWVNHDDTPSAADQKPSNYGAFALEISKQANPGTLDFFAAIEYRLIGA